MTQQPMLISHNDTTAYIDVHYVSPSNNDTHQEINVNSDAHFDSAGRKIEHFAYAFAWSGPLYLSYVP